MALSQLEVTGAEVYAATAGNELVRRGHSVFYVSDTISCKVQGRFTPLAFNKRGWPRRIWQIVKLIWLIKHHQVQLVHAHSRASGWACFIACKLTRTPMVTTVHGRQPVHASRKVFPAFGYKAVAICEDVRDQLITALDVPEDRVSVIRNGFDVDRLQQLSGTVTNTITIIGRLTGPKGELCYRLLNESLSDLIEQRRVNVRVITASAVPARFEKFKRNVEFPGYTADIAKEISRSTLIIGAGRVAVEALLLGRHVYAIGEAKAIGLVTQHNVREAMRSNFGDIGPKVLDIDFEKIRQDLHAIVEHQGTDVAPDDTLRETILPEYSLSHVVSQLETLYQDAVIETLTPKDLVQKGFIHRLTPDKKFLILTADDGYKDNLTRMLPLLEKYDLKATVFVVSDETHNRWDTDHPTNPDTKIGLLTPDEIRALDQSGRVEIGGHTLSHAKLDELPKEEQRREILENKKQLEEILGHPILSFAYPFGNLNDSSKQEVKAAGYELAFATDSGPKALHQDCFQIRRINVFPRTDVFGLWRKTRGNYVWKR